MSEDGFVDDSGVPPEIQGILKKTDSQEAVQKRVSKAAERVNQMFGPGNVKLEPDPVSTIVPQAGEMISLNQMEIERTLKEKRAMKLLRRIQKLRIEALKLYEPMDHIDVFHSSPAQERVLRGSNRSGKTLGAAVEIARAVTGQDPYHKYPEENGRCFVVGKDGKHNSEVLYRKLFRAGAYSIIRDAATGVWRAWRPWDPADFARKSEIKPAPPLIPPRLIVEVGWENKKEQVPNVVRLTNGWELRFFSSLGSPPQGSDVDLVWFDEEIVDPEWYGEVAARGTIDRRGKFVWSATAQKGGEQLYELCMSAEAQKEEPNPRVVEVFAHIANNRYFSDDQRDQFSDKLTEEQRRIRIEGEFAFTSFRVYPEFDINVHGCDYFQIPNDWCRFMVVDPGRQVCAVLFGAVAPPWDDERQDQLYLYDELYIHQSSATKFAEQVFSKINAVSFHAFIIDRHGSRITESGSGMTVERQYSDALREKSIASASTGSGFIWGSDDVDGGIEAFRKLLTIRRDGTPRVKVMRERMPYFEYEVTRYSYIRKGGVATDKPSQRNNHLMDCARYLALYEPKWYPPPKRTAKRNPVLDIIKEKRRKAARESGSGRVTLGPGGSSRDYR